MRFVRNEIQKPQYVVSREKRKSIAFYVLFLGILVLFIGFVAFFAISNFREPVQERWGIPYRRMQTYSLVVGGIGIILYIIGASILKIPLRKTTYYKIQTIIRNEVFDPPKKGDFTKPILARLRNLDDDWALFMEVNPPESSFIIPQVITGPGGVFATHPLNMNPQRKQFSDPGPEFERASRKLGAALNTQVIPIIVFSTPKLVQIYKEEFKVKTRVMHIRQLADYFEQRKGKLTEDQRNEIESKVFGYIKGTTPGSVEEDDRY